MVIVANYGANDLLQSPKMVMVMAGYGLIFNDVPTFSIFKFLSSKNLRFFALCLLLMTGASDCDCDRDHLHSVYHNNGTRKASIPRSYDSHGSVATPISLWNQQNLKKQTQKEQKIKDHRQKLVELSRPTHPMSPATKRRLQALEQNNH